MLSALAVLAAAKALLVLDAGLEGRSVERPPSAAASALPDAPAPAEELLAEPAAGPEDEPPSTDAAGTGPVADGTGEGRAARTFTPGELDALSRLVERRLELLERERELDLRAALLDDAEARLRARAADLEALRAQVAALIKQHDEAEEAKFARLVKIYESMKPKAAAAIFDRLEMKVLVEVVGRMREGVSSEVIGRMNPERAEGLTEELARRRRVPPLEEASTAGPAG